MTKAEATNMIKNDIHLHHDYLSGEYRKALKMAISALEQPEIINCFECTHYKPMSNSWGKCYVHSSRTERYRTCQSCDYCSWAVRRQDD